MDVTQHAEHPHVLPLFLNKTGQHLECLFFVVFLDEHVDALLLEAGLREQLYCRHAQTQMHVPVCQDKNKSEVSLVRRGIEGLGGLVGLPVEN